VKIKIRVVEGEFRSFLTRPDVFYVEFEIGALHFQTKNFWLREQDAIRHADYIADKILECEPGELAIETRGDHGRPDRS